ncbi:MAG: hypothetical protein IPJ77_19950 [Planctomycetes bacterium]|nr:hypothetical protein [Planctomycetota bacterium]
MKPIVAILGLVVAAAAGAVGGIVASSTAAPAPVEVAAHSSAAKAETSASAASVTIDQTNFEKELRDLSDEVLRLRAELAAVREGRVRETAVEGTPTKVGEEIPAESLAILHKDAILRVIAEDRAEQQRKEDDAHKQQQLEQALQRAERVGKELNLSKGEQQKLAEVYAMEREKRDEFMSKMRQGDVPDRDQMRQSFQEYRDWRTTELTNRLGADLATKVNEYDGDRMGFGGRMFGGPDGGGGGASATGGNNNGGGGRRNRPGGGNNNGGNNAGGGPGGG